MRSHTDPRWFGSSAALVRNPFQNGLGAALLSVIERKQKNLLNQKSNMSKRTAGVQEVQRRRWDDDAYSERAEKRRKGLEELAEARSNGHEGSGYDREAKLVAAEELIGKQARTEGEADADALQERAIGVLQAGRGAQGPALSERAWLKRRDFKVHLEDKVGKSALVTAGATGVQGGGFYCPVTKVTLKDSQSYLDHINGRKYQKALGYGMRVERSSAADVRSKLKGLKRNMEPTGRLAPKQAELANAPDIRSKRKRKRGQQEREQERGLGGMMDAESLAKQMGVMGEPRAEPGTGIAQGPFERSGRAGDRVKDGGQSSGREPLPKRARLDGGPWQEEGAFAEQEEVPGDAIDWDLAQAMGVSLSLDGAEAGGQAALR